MIDPRVKEGPNPAPRANDFRKVRPIASTGFNSRTPIGGPPVGRAHERRAGGAACGSRSLHGDAGFPGFSRGVWDGLCRGGPRVRGALRSVGAETSATCLFPNETVRAALK